MTSVRRFVAPCLAAVVIVLAMPAAAGGQPAPGTVRTIAVDTSDYPLIDAVVAVPRVVTGGRLRADDVEVLEGGTSRAVEVEALDPADVALAVVVDPALAARELGVAQGGLLELAVHLPEPEVAVVAAGRPAQVLLPATRDPEAMGAALRDLSSGGQSAITEGIDAAIDEFPADATRRVMVVVPAGPGAADTEWEPVIARAENAGVIVYVISLGSTIEPGLARLANTSGGLASAVGRTSFLSAVDRLMTDLRGQYRVRVQLAGDAVYAPVTMMVTGTTGTASVRLPVDPTVGRSEGQMSTGGSSRPGLPGPDPGIVILVLAVAATLVAAIAFGITPAPRR